MDNFKRGPGRPPRTDRPQKEQRRRKAGELDGNNYKLAAPVDAPALKGYQIRWFNDEGTRIHDKTVLDDWDFVTKSEVTVRGRIDVGSPDLSATIDPGDRVSIPVNLGGGIVTKAYLCKKKIEYFKADRAELLRKNEKQLEGLHRTGIEKQTGKVDIN